VTPVTRCGCTDIHVPRRIVLTGGPGAGKTAVLELIRQAFCEHVKVLPEAAGIVFGGGFPRDAHADVQRAAQRAIFYVQRELEAAATLGHPAIVLCDRGTIDSAAYWPGPGDFWAAVDTSVDEQLRRYAAVIHLRVPGPNGGYNQQNPLRIETAAEAAAIDARINMAWAHHPQRFLVEATTDFLTKASRAIEILRDELPECCRQHVVPALSDCSGPGTTAGAVDAPVFGADTA